LESTRKGFLAPQPQEKYDLTIRARNVTVEIIEASKDNVKIRSNCTGEVNGSLYSGSYYDTVEAIPVQDGTLVLIIRYLHMTQRGELVWGNGTGTRRVPDPNGMTKLNAEGIMWTSSPRLSQLNGKRWVESKNIVFPDAGGPTSTQCTDSLGINILSSRCFKSFMFFKFPVFECYPINRITITTLITEIG
jgi:hypothetical protein